MGVGARRVAALARAAHAAWLFAGATLLVLAAVEGAARVVWALLPPPSAFDEAHAGVLADFEGAPELGREREFQRFSWHPYVYWRHRPFDGRHVHVDAQGLRDTWNAAGPEGALDIQVFGGSTAWGWGAPDDATIPSLISRSLAQTLSTPVHVTNRAQFGYVSTQGLIALTLDLRAGRVPDAVVFYDGVNDVFSAYQAGRAGDPKNEWRRREDFESVRRAFQRRLAGHLATVKLVRRAFAPDPEPPVDPARLAAEVVRAYAGNLRVVESMAAAFGFEVRFYWQPTVWLKSGLTPYERAAGEHYAYLEALYRAAAAEIAAHPELSRNPRFGDLGKILADREEPLFLDFCHIGPAGNRIVAEQIAADLAEALRRRNARVEAVP
jgi:lysophospholipase L1-like esterase